MTEEKKKPFKQYAKEFLVLTGNTYKGISADVKKVSKATSKQYKKNFEPVVKDSLRVGEKATDRFIGAFSKGKFLSKTNIESVDPKKIIRTFNYQPLVRETPQSQRFRNHTGWFSNEFINEKKGFDKSWLYSD